MYSFLSLSQDDEGECPTSLDSEFGGANALFEPRAVPNLVTLAAEAYLAIPNVWALERFIKKATPKVSQWKGAVLQIVLEC